MCVCVYVLLIISLLQPSVITFPSSIPQPLPPVQLRYPAGSRGSWTHAVLGHECVEQWIITLHSFSQQRSNLSADHYAGVKFKWYVSKRALVSACELKPLGGRNDEIKGTLLHLPLLYMFEVLDFHDDLLILFAFHRNVRLSLLSAIHMEFEQYLTGNQVFSKWRSCIISHARTMSLWTAVSVCCQTEASQLTLDG